MIVKKLLLICKLISISNHIFGREIWDKWHECISGNFEIFKNHEG